MLPSEQELIMRGRILAAFLAVLLSPNFLQAAPAVTGASGQLQQGQSLVITGSGFGTHADFHSASDKMIRVFDDFNDGTLTTNPYLTWSVFNGSAGPVKYATDNPRTSTAGDGFYRRTNVG